MSLRKEKTFFSGEFSQKFKLGQNRFVKAVLLLLATTLFSLPLHAEKLQVVATTTDLASIAEEVGGDRVEVTSLAPGNADLHFLSARPDYIRAMSKADVFVLVGMDLEVGWVPVLLTQARNAQIQKGRPGYVDASIGVHPLQVPVGEIHRGMGDVHALGNPHFWPDPLRGVAIARNIRNALVRIDPAGEAVYEKNYVAFRNRASALAQKLINEFKPYQGTPVIVYHREFDYLANRYGFRIVMEIEPKPGVAPGPRRLRKVAKYASENNVHVIIAAPWSNLAAARRVAKESGAKLIVLPIQTKSGNGTDDYFAMVETVANMLLTAFKEAK